MRFTADIVVFRKRKEDTWPEVLLIRRRNNPFKDCLALPGGFVEENETSKFAAIRELKEETNLTVTSMSFIGIWDNPNRDPRGRTITAAYATKITHEESKNAIAGDDAYDTVWLPLYEVENRALAFDHKEILREAAGLYSLWR